MLSIIIPTLNEEKYLPLLLDSIKKQEFNDYEIIISDAGSKDKTLDITRNHNCRIVSGGLPSLGKNRGGESAKGDILLFLDADTVLPEGFLNNFLAEFKKRNLDLGSFRLLPLEKNLFFYLILNLFYNIPIIVLEKIIPHSATGIVVKKQVFSILNGFDETIKLAEDHDLSRRAKKKGFKCGILRSTKVFTSDRRFKKDGWLKICFSYFFCELHMIFLGPVKSDLFKYRFDHYSDKD